MTSESMLSVSADVRTVMRFHVHTNTFQATKTEMRFLAKFMVKENYVSELLAQEVLFSFLMRHKMCQPMKKHENFSETLRELLFLIEEQR